MFNLFKKKKIEVFSPATGKMVQLESVPDQVFASKMMGEGVAFVLDQDEVCAPIDGRISLIPETKHAFGIVSSTGLEILVHIGLDTVKLGGEGFSQLVNQGDKVSKGMPVIKVDRASLTEKGFALVTPMIVTNSSDFEISLHELGDVSAGESIVFECLKK